MNRTTVRVRGGRASARGAQARIRANDLGVRIIEQRSPQKPKSFPPKQRIRKLEEMIRQNDTALKQTKSYAAYKRAAVLRAHLEVAQLEEQLPAVW